MEIKNSEKVWEKREKIQKKIQNKSGGNPKCVRKNMIVCNRGCESRRWYQEQVMHAGEQQWESKNSEKVWEEREKIQEKKI